MYFKFCTLSIINVLTVSGFKVFSINDGFKGLLEEIESRSVESLGNFTELWIDQKVDHFDETDTRMWKMKYYQDLQFWKPNGPIYLFINGEAPASPRFLTTGVMYELAKETEGAMYLSEHRYYGESQPVNRSQFNVQDMKFLSAAQALADNANLLRNVKNNTDYENSKVVVIGGSYAGNLAAWFKLLYSDLVDAAISSSSPIIAKRDFYEYLEVVGNDYMKFGSADCIEKIRSIFQRYELLLQTEDGTKQLKTEMNICEETDLNRLENRQLFFLSQTYNFMIHAQYGSTKGIQNHCSKLLDAQNTLLQLDRKYYWRSDEKCYDYDFDKTITEYQKPEGNDNLCWAYQTCTEFGYFQSGTSTPQPFTNNVAVEWFDKLCSALFGDDFDKDKVDQGVKNTNDMYGGKSTKVTKVVFVNGEMDPWSSLGIIEGGSPDAPVVYIPRSSHCKDLLSNQPGDEEELIQARNRIKDQIKEWIGTSANVNSKVMEN